MHKRNLLYQFGFSKQALLGNKLNLFCFVTLLGYALVALATKVGWLAANWQVEVGGSYEQPNSIYYFGQMS